MTPNVITLRNLRLTLVSRAGPVEILRGIDFTANEGEAVGIVGPSGSGKTTLLLVAAGLERATSGEVIVMGENLVSMSEDRLTRFRRDNLGIIFQAFHLIPTMTALENVAIPLELRGTADAFSRAAEKLRRVGLGNRLQHYPGELSGGEQQRVAIARAVANVPRILLADEPTGNLDSDTADLVFGQLLALVRQTGLAALIATHNPDLAGRMDRRVILKDGVLSQ